MKHAMVGGYGSEPFRGAFNVRNWGRNRAGPRNAMDAPNLSSIASYLGKASASLRENLVISRRVAAELRPMSSEPEPSRSGVNDECGRMCTFRPCFWCGGVRNATGSCEHA